MAHERISAEALTTHNHLTSPSLSVVVETLGIWFPKLKACYTVALAIHSTVGRDYN